jgi:REP element-mobilizing transposase RayT
MSEKYKIYDNDKAYFVTLTVVGWLDVFTRVNHKLKIVESLKCCQENKGLTIFAWVLMPSHLHMVARGDGAYALSEILRDFKKHTSKEIIKQIKEEPESRRGLLLREFENEGKKLKRIKYFKFWQDGNHPKEICTNRFLNEKLKYIHLNPVEEMFVAQPADYLYSSARNYAELDYLLEVELIDQQLRTYDLYRKKI